MKPAGKMDISLTPELEEMVQAEVARGTFATTSEVIRQALRDRYKAEKLKELDDALDRGIADIAAGRALPIDDAFAHVRTSLDSRTKARIDAGYSRSVSDRRSHSHRPLHQE
jgi:antitoxin ParD1/3/4